MEENQRRSFTVGSFAFAAGDGKVVMTDMTGNVRIEVSENTVHGVMLRQLVEMEGRAFLHGYAATMYNLLTTVTDLELVSGITVLVAQALERHRDLYPDFDVSEEEHARALEDLRAIAGLAADVEEVISEAAPSAQA